VEMVRFTNSGGEAVGSAIRIARAYTGRRLVIRFEGHYHGWQDPIYWSNHVDPRLAGPASRPRPVPSGPGVPAELEATLIVLTWNDPDSFTAVMEERGDQVAAVITEPAVFNTGSVPAELEATLIVLTWNDPDSFTAVMEERGDQVAAVITEPAVFNTGCILPEPGYLELLREQTRKHGALLIFDEVITGFRFARGGA